MSGTVLTGCLCFGNDVPRKNVVLRFLRSELLYDVSNNAFIESDVLGDANQHGSHLLADVAEKGNVDRVSRILALVHASVVEMLYPYTKQTPVDETLNNVMSEPTEYIITMSIPETMSRTTLELLTQQIHEYIVASVLADWLSITHPDASAKWKEKADQRREEITSSKNYRSRVFTRKISPI